ncbi:hypothetical protein ACJ41O_008716 [Fusarium nematophilum]
MTTTPDNEIVCEPKNADNIAMAAEKVESTQEASEVGQVDAQPRVHLTTFMALFAICLIYFSQTFALVGTGAQGQTISRFFNRPGDYTWLTGCLTIPSVVLGPIVAQMADYWGRRWLLVLSSLVGAVGCVVASRADSFAIMLLGLTLTGLEFGVLPLLHAVPSEILPRRWRAPAQAAVMIANSFGLIVGLIAGGAFTRDSNDMQGFRNYYYIATGLFAAATVICFFAYRPPARALQTSLTLREKLSQLDWVGYGLLASSLVLFCVGLTWSQNPYEWSDPHTSATFSVGVALGIALVVYETKFKRDGMFHHGLFSGNWNFAISLVAIFCEGLAFFAAAVYFPFQIAFLYEGDAVIAAVRFSIAFMATIPASVVTGLYCTVTKKVRWVTVLSFIIFVAFFACMATTDEGSGDSVWGYPVLLGWALGMTLITLVTVAQLSTPPELISIASGLVISVRSLGGTVGIAIYNAVFIEETQHAGERIASAAVAAGLSEESVPELVEHILGHDETGVGMVPGVTPQIVGSALDALFDAFARGFRNVWITAAAFVALSTVATVFLVDPSNEFNRNIDAPVERQKELYTS